MSVVPACPHGLTLSREDFLSDDFTVDNFLTRWHASAASSSAVSVGRPRTLETLRDDLGIYLKVLRSAMIELINEDYADFVNLSTNLVGLDKGIVQLEEPLLKYKAQVEDARGALEGALAALNQKLARRESLYAKKIALQNLEHITNTLAKVERLLGLGSSSGEPVEMSGDLVERVATEINHLNFCVSKCEASTFVEEMQPRLKVIGDHLHGSLEQQLLGAVASGEAEVLKRCLRIFATVDRIKDAEELVKTRVVRPALEECINEKSLLEDPMGLKGVMQRVMKVIPDKLSLLLQLTSAHKRRTSTRGAKDYDFLTNSLFAEVVEQIEDNLSFIFSAGNPDRFFVNYQVNQEFLNELELQLGTVEAVESLRATKSYQSFLSRWNLPVYFQIRFQEIALPVEMSLQTIFEEAAKQGQFRLTATDKATFAIEQCWSGSIYVDALVHRFWKLTLQIISRYTHSVKNAPEQPVPVEKEPEDELKASATSTNLKDLSKPMGHIRSSSDTSLSSQPQQPEPEKYRSRPKELINLYVDVSAFANHVSTVIYPETILPRLGELTDAQTQILNASLEEGCSKLKEQLPVLSEILVDGVASKSLPYLKQVSDIPRLYRRTNREVPSKPCSYLTALLGPITAFHSSHGGLCPKDAMHSWLVSIFKCVTAQFVANVSDVLSAVQKMEESLRRLKRVRDTKAGAGGAGGARGTVVSDDDKIRLQLALDVRHFVEKMGEEFGVGKEEVDKVVDLEEMVTEATKNIEEKDKA